MTRHIILLASFIMLASPLVAQKKLMTNLGHAGNINSISYSPDGQYLASAGEDQSIVLWHLPSGKELRRLKGHEQEVKSIDFSPDGLHLVSGSRDATLIIWDVTTGEIVNHLKGHSAFVNAVDYSPDGLLVVSASSDETVKIWDPVTALEIHSLKGHSAPVNTVKFSPDGRMIASGSDDNSIRLWNTRSGDLINSLRYFSLSLGGDKSDAISSIDFSPDGEYILSGSMDHLVRIWSITSGHVVQTFEEHEWPVTAVAYSSFGNFVASGSHDNTIRVWNLNTGQQVYKVQQGSFVNDLEFSPDGKWLVSCGDDDAINVWDLEQSKPNQVLSKDVHIDNQVPMAVSPVGKKIIAGVGNKALKIWEVSRGMIKRQIQMSSVRTTAFSPDGQRFVTINKHQSSEYMNSIGLWDVRSGNLIGSFGKPFLEGNVWTELPAVFSPDGKYFVTGHSNDIDLWDISTRRKLKSLEHSRNSGVYSIDFLPDGKSLAVGGGGIHGGEKGIIQIWSLEKDSLIAGLSGHDSGVSAVKISPDGGRLYSASFDNTIKIWNLNENKLIKTLDGHGIFSRSFFDEVGITSLDLSKDGTLLLSGGMDRNVVIWDAETGEKVFVLEGHLDAIAKVSFSSNGEFVFSQSHDQSIKIWSAITGDLLATLIDFSSDDNKWLIYTPNGQFDGTQDAFDKLHIVDEMNVIPLESYFESFYTPNLLAKILDQKFTPRIEMNIEDLELPPLVKILNPMDGTDVKKKEVSMTVEVKDQGGGIGEIRVYLNGKLVNTAQRGFRNAENLHHFDLVLSNGTNEIKVTALNDQKTESLPDQIYIEYEGLKKASNLHMLVVGIDQYKNPQYNLNYAIADATAFKERVEQTSLSMFNEVNVIYLKDDKFTRENFISAFEEISLQAFEEDVFVFYYAGHGVMSEENVPKFYIVPHGVTQLYGDNGQLRELAISGEDLKDFSMDVRAQKQLYVLDACQSGGMADMLAKRGNAEEKAIAQLARSTGTFWLTASSSEQFATEFEELGHGLFTYAVLAGLSGEADGGKKDQKITVKELSAFLNDKVPELSELYKGEAQYPRSYGFGQDFPIVLVPENPFEPKVELSD